MSSFPRRTAESDLNVYLVKTALDKINAPRNYMVCVVTLSNGKVVVASSGGGGTIVLRLDDKLNWQSELAALAPSKSKMKKVNKKVRKNTATNEDMATLRNKELIDKLKTVVNLHGKIRSKILTNRNANISNALLTPIKGWAIDPSNGNFFQDLTIGRRDCAEPRALEVAANLQAKITGMTTIWYGNPSRNDYRDDRQFCGFDIDAAFPCEFCRQNEVRIMKSIYLKKGGRQRRYSI